MNSKIVQTPSHLHLFERVKNQSNVEDCRDSMGKAYKRSALVKGFFSQGNKSMLESKIRNIFLSSYKYRLTEPISELLNMTMTNIYVNNNDLLELDELNSIVLSNGSKTMYKSLQSHNQYLKDKNSTYTLMNRPTMTSNKIEKQLPRMSYL